MSGWVYVIVGGVLLAIGSIFVGYGFHKLSKPADNIVIQIKGLYDRIDKQLNASKVQVSQIHKGVSLHFVLSIHRGKGRNRRYLYDLGNAEKSRISLYLDPSDKLAFSLLDSYGEPYSIRVPPKDLTFDTFIYLACEAGVFKNSSFLKMLIDGEQVAYQEIPTHLAMLSSVESPLKSSKCVIGADLLGNNGSEIDIVELVEYPSTLTTKDLTQLLTYFKNKELKQYISYSENQWLYRPPGGNDLIQENDAFKPLLRKLSQK